MAHWAQLDSNNVVTQVIVIDNSKSNEGYDFLIENLGGTWVKTSYNTRLNLHSQNGVPLRKNFAGIGYSYDATRDAFIAPKPFESWILNEETCGWEAPVSKPTENDEELFSYVWDEESISWLRVG